ncbi:hypothetical protein PF002_g20777 [Phytophthora fragariae]|uniref:Uncharacterized protein n=1 Tax=Phytophthora fragariae TaxID=53985 RepID=A0A6A3XJY5_9STRA|nr:hypothetical protein PF002_g20777 [Phytophthora fragariae]
MHYVCELKAERLAYVGNRVYAPTRGKKAGKAAAALPAAAAQKYKELQHRRSMGERDNDCPVLQLL